MVPEQTISDIKNRLSIVDVVGEYVVLKKAGQTYVGLCPFHKEKSPSFNVHPIRQIFHCFGCHKGGDIFTFLTSIEGLTFPQALEKLAGRAGISIEQKKNDYHRAPAKIEQETLDALDALKYAARYYNYLLTQRPEGKVALNYLHSRGITEKSITRFNLGVSLSGWSGLRDQMARRNYSTATLVTAGLLSVKDTDKNESNPRTYDRFRERLMFPITDKDGKVIGFGARRLNEDENTPKYLNSSDSPIFSKRKNLYGLFENTRGIRVRGEAILVEGYMDVVGLWEKGVDNSIAVMGTALTEEHCHLIRHFTNNILTVFDPDRAGEDAWRQSLHQFMDSGIIARDVSLPKGIDPDEFVRQHGSEKFYELCIKAPRHITKWLKQIAERGRLSEKETNNILGAISPILRAIRKLPDRVTIWDDISLLLGVSVISLKELSESQIPFSPISPSPKGTGNQINLRVQSTPRTKKLDSLDLAFLCAALECPQKFQGLNEKDWVPAIREPLILETLTAMRSNNRESDSLQKLLAQCGENHELGAAITAHLVVEPTPTPTSEAELAFAELEKALKRRIIDSEVTRLSAQARLAQRIGNESESLEVLGKIRNLRVGTEAEKPTSSQPPKSVVT